MSVEIKGSKGPDLRGVGEGEVHTGCSSLSSCHRWLSPLPVPVPNPGDPVAGTGAQR